jgi:hypothetical protein
MVTQTTKKNKVLELVRKACVLRPRDLPPTEFPGPTSAACVQPASCNGSAMGCPP